jgi:hypothetical protein
MFMSTQDCWGSMKEEVVVAVVVAALIGDNDDEDFTEEGIAAPQYCSVAEQYDRQRGK